MANTKNLRQTHRFIAPIMLLPALLTRITRSIYQIVAMAGHGAAFEGHQCSLLPLWLVTTPVWLHRLVVDLMVSVAGLKFVGLRHGSNFL